jgi:hypothetical protein
MVSHFKCARPPVATVHEQRCELPNSHVKPEYLITNRRLQTCIKCKLTCKITIDESKASSIMIPPGKQSHASTPPVPNCRSFGYFKTHHSCYASRSILMSRYILTTMNLDLTKRSTIGKEAIHRKHSWIENQQSSVLA